MSQKAGISFVLACVFMDALGIGLIIPVLPGLIGTLAGSHELQTTWYGFIMLSYGLMQFMFSPILGALSDKIGRRPVLLIGILGLALMMVIPAFSHSLWLIFFSRLIGGMMSSNIVVAQAYIADITPCESRVSSFGKIGAIFGIAFVLGPALGGVLGQYDIRLPFIVASAICLINFIYGVLVLPESLKEKNTSPINLKHVNPFSAIAHLARIRPLLPLLLITTLYTLAQSLMTTTWALYTQYRYGWTPLWIGLSVFGLGLCISLTQGLILPKMSKKYQPQSIVLAGLLVGAISLLVIGLSPWGALSLVFCCLTAVLGIVGPSIRGEVSNYCTKETQGINLGAISSLNSFTGAISPIIGTPLLIVTTSNTEHPILAGAPYFIGSLLVIASLVIALRRPIKGSKSYP